MGKKEIQAILGARVKLRRKEKKLTREQLAEKIDVSVRFLADVESGAVGVSLATLKELCEALELSADYLLGMDTEPHKSEYVGALHRLLRIPTEHLHGVEAILDELLRLMQTNEKA